MDGLIVLLWTVRRARSGDATEGEGERPEAQLLGGRQATDGTEGEAEEGGDETSLLRLSHQVSNKKLLWSVLLKKLLISTKNSFLYPAYGSLCQKSDIGYDMKKYLTIFSQNEWNLNKKGIKVGRCNKIRGQALELCKWAYRNKFEKLWEMFVPVVSRVVPEC